MAEKEKRSPPVWPLTQVVSAFAVFYLVLFLFDAPGLHRWTDSLPMSQGSLRLRTMALAHKKKMRQLGLDTFKLKTERAFQMACGHHCPNEHSVAISPVTTPTTTFHDEQAAHPPAETTVTGATIAARAAAQTATLAGIGRKLSEAVITAANAGKIEPPPHQPPGKPDSPPFRRKMIARNPAGASTAWQRPLQPLQVSMAAMSPQTLTEFPNPERHTDPGTGAPRVLLVGDSIMLGLGPAVRSDIARRLKGSAVVTAKVSTGLSTPFHFNWPKTLALTIAANRYDYIFIMIGTNDGQGLWENRRIISYGSWKWPEVYSRRIGEFMNLACRGARKVYWLGLPPMRSNNLQNMVTNFNSLARHQSSERQCVDYVSLDSIIGDSAGRFATYLPVEGRFTRVRAGDGIHLTPQGARVISEQLLKMIAPSQVIP